MTQLWIEGLRTELEKIDSTEFLEPTEEVDPKDRVVAILDDDDWKRLYTLVLKWSDEAEVLLAEANPNGNRLNEKSGLLADLFWIEIKERYNLFGKPFVDVRKGWKIVYRDNVPIRFGERV